MQSEQVRRQIETIGIVPCARVRLPEHALWAAETLYDAGIPIVEVTLTLPQATEVIADLAKRYPDMVVGAGTVLDEQAALHRRRCAVYYQPRIHSRGCGLCEKG
jgi:2-dehydro-3-deoxyphosphogluconate aldolase / (4S)-4-hydroxy-2-oxoglutarate aldolase